MAWLVASLMLRSSAAARAEHEADDVTATGAASEAAA
jgi:hypothetical protein